VPLILLQAGATHTCLSTRLPKTCDRARSEKRPQASSPHIIAGEVCGHYVPAGSTLDSLVHEGPRRARAAKGEELFDQIIAPFRLAL
jgi:hypothetical protein